MTTKTTKTTTPKATAKAAPKGKTLDIRKTGTGVDLHFKDPKVEEAAAPKADKAPTPKAEKTPKAKAPKAKAEKTPKAKAEKKVREAKAPKPPKTLGDAGRLLRSARDRVRFLTHDTPAEDFDRALTEALAFIETAKARIVAEPRRTKKSA